jgi:hypothetical protein
MGVPAESPAHAGHAWDHVEHAVREAAAGEELPELMTFENNKDVNKL